MYHIIIKVHGMVVLKCYAGWIFNSLCFSWRILEKIYLLNQT